MSTNNNQALEQLQAPCADIATRLWKDFTAGAQFNGNGDTGTAGGLDESEPRESLVAAERLARTGPTEPAISAFVDLVQDYPKFLAGRLAAVQTVMELGDDALALELLELTEADFALENTEFAELIRADIGARRPDLVNRLRAGNVLGAAAARQDDGRGLLSLGQDFEPAATAHIYTITFLDFAGQRVFPGGAERYIFDLAKIMEDLGQSVTVYQGGNDHWERQIGNIRVIAIPWNNSLYELSVDFAQKTRAGSVNIYSPFTLAVANLAPAVDWNLPWCLLG